MDCTDGFCRNFGNNDQDDFRVVSGILRLATKYLIDSLRAKALAHLYIAWPLDLKAWEAREDLLRSYEVNGFSHDHRYPHPFVSDPSISEISYNNSLKHILKRH
jgi:hypothetical protein